MQNQVYSRYLYQTLMEYGHVAVPNLGVFALEFTEAVFNHDRSLLKPPHSKAIFYRSSSSIPLISQLLVESGMPSSDAQSIEKALVEDYHSATEKQIPFELDNFGTVINHIFLEKNPAFFNRFEGLSDMEIKALTIGAERKYPYRFATTQEDIAYAPAPKASFFSEYWLPLTVAILTFITILWWLMSSSSENPNASNQLHNVGVTNDLSIVDTPYVAEGTSTVTTLDNEGIAEENIVDENTDATQGTMTVQDADTMVINSDTPSCIVIIGAFSQQSNAQRLLRKIAAKGYGTYTAQVNGLSRVGIKYDCKANDPEVFKSMIKTEFNKQAWHLHDTLK